MFGTKRLKEKIVWGQNDSDSIQPIPHLSPNYFKGILGKFEYMSYTTMQIEPLLCRPPNIDILALLGLFLKPHMDQLCLS